MDPNANIERQRELADDIARIQDAGADSSPYSIEELAFELAEHVTALDVWRSKGGFDPYKTDEEQDAERAIEILYEVDYKGKMRALAETLRQACAEAGLAVDSKVWDMSADEYRWSFSVFTSAMARMAKRFEHSIDVSILIAESREYDGEDAYGVNFAVDIVHHGGLIVGGLTPYNYTEQVWVDARDSEAVSDRWKILADANAGDVPALIADWIENNPEER